MHAYIPSLCPSPPGRRTFFPIYFALVRDNRPSRPDASPFAPFLLFPFNFVSDEPRTLLTVTSVHPSLPRTHPHTTHAHARTYSLGIFGGFAAFFVMEKTLRVLGGGEDGHSHSHSHSHTEEKQGSGETEGTASGVAAGSTNGLRERKKVNGEDHQEGEGEEKHAQVSKLSAYLNLFGDFCHNMCVGFFFSAVSSILRCKGAHSPIFICAERTVSRTSVRSSFGSTTFVAHRQ